MADLLAFVALLVATRRPRAGMVLICVASVCGLGLDPTGIGLSSYIGVCAVVLTVRQGLFAWAALGTAVLISTMSGFILRRASDVSDIPGAVFGVALVLGTAWLVGLGFRWVARVEAERVSKEYVERQVRMAVDIHDFVGRNLTGVLLSATHASPADRADPRFLDELVARVRSADATLRQVTADLQREGAATPFTAVGAADALRAGVVELEAGGMRVELDPDAELLVSDVPPEVDLVVSRIVAEALHNVLKHADRAQPCQIDVGRDGDLVSIIVSNGVKPRHADRRRPQLGLVGMRRHSALAGGTAVSAREGDRWVCRVCIPVRRTEVAA